MAETIENVLLEIKDRMDEGHRPYMTTNIREAKEGGGWEASISGIGAGHVGYGDTILEAVIAAGDHILGSFRNTDRSRREGPDAKCGYDYRGVHVEELA